MRPEAHKAFSRDFHKGAWMSQNLSPSITEFKIPSWYLRYNLWRLTKINPDLKSKSRFLFIISKTALKLEADSRKMHYFHTGSYFLRYNWNLHPAVARAILPNGKKCFKCMSCAFDLKQSIHRIFHTLYDLYKNIDIIKTYNIFLGFVPTP